MSSSTDHLANARDYIARGEDYYRKAADEIIAARSDDDMLSWREIERRVGKSNAWCRQLVQWRTNVQDAAHAPFGGEQENEARYQRQANTALKDPERRQQAIAALPTAQVEQVIEQAHKVVLDRVQAAKAEHDTAERPATAGDLMGGDRFDPSESWADAEILRVREKAHALRRQVEKWGLVLGSLDEEQAFSYLQEAERNIADVRAALQERMADRARTEA